MIMKLAEGRKEISRICYSYNILALQTVYSGSKRQRHVIILLYNSPEPFFVGGVCSLKAFSPHRPATPF